MADAVLVVNDEMFTQANGDRPDIPNYLVLITDGRSDNRTATVMEAERLRRAGVVVVVVGVGNDIDLIELSLIASNPTSSTVLLSFETYIGVEVIDGIVYIICRNEIACQSQPCLNGGTCVDQVAGTYSCRCPDSFTGPQCERGCSARMSKIKSGGLDQYGAEPFERQQFGTAGVEGVNVTCP